MIRSPRMDDDIIYSWCFNSVECFDSTPSAAIIILEEDWESFSSLRSQQCQHQKVNIHKNILYIMNFLISYLDFRMSSPLFHRHKFSHIEFHLHQFYFPIYFCNLFMFIRLDIYRPIYFNYPFHTIVIEY